MCVKGRSVPASRVLRTLVLSFLLLFAAVVMPVSASFSPQSTWIGHIYITDVKDSSLVISWMTSTPANGVARCYTPGGTLVRQVTDTVASTTTHYVVITGLTASTQYLCEVESAGIIANNGGARYPVTTGPTQGPPPPGNEYVYGYIYKPDGTTPAPNVIVYLRLHDSNGTGTLGRSQWVTARAESTGVWAFNLFNVRTADAMTYFTYTPGTDFMEIWINGGEDGTWGYPPLPDAVMTIPPTFPAQLPPAVLQQFWLAVTLAGFSANSQENGIQVAWQTTTEINNQGFNLYRSMDSSGPQEVLAFVPSQAPGSGQGASYEWLDTQVETGETYYYWLEAISQSGTTTLFEPVSATYQAPTAVDIAAFTAQAVDGSALTRWLLALPAVLAGGIYALRRRSR